MIVSGIQAYIEYNSKTKKFYLNDGDEMKESTNGTWVFILKATKITNNFMFNISNYSLFILQFSLIKVLYFIVNGQVVLFYITW